MPIDAKNMEQHGDRLMAARMELMRRFPIHRIDVYAARRSAMVPEQGATNVLANGAITMLLLSRSVADYPYFNPEQKSYEGAGIHYLRSLSTTLEPARETGTQTLLWYPLSYDQENQRAVPRAAELRPAAAAGHRDGAGQDG